MTERPSEMMRRAARLMWERAKPMPPPPWRAEGRDVTATQDYNWDYGFEVAESAGDRTRPSTSRHGTPPSPWPSLAGSTVRPRSSRRRRGHP